MASLVKPDGISEGIPDGTQADPAGKAEVFIGTSGYSYTDWVGPFYPKGTDRRDFLSYYATRFPLVELNYSYYRQPSPELSEQMVDRTSERFSFTIKGHGSLTHEVTDSWRTSAATFTAGVRPLVESRRLGAVLLQFPYRFHYSDANRIYLAELCEELAPLPLVLEFRNRDWQQPKVFEGMRTRSIGYAATDYPSLRNLPTPSAQVTSDIGYIRFHGRNEKNWWSGDNASRYDYLYDSEELAGWLTRIEQMAGKTRVLLIVFNNHWGGQAVQNAFELKALLTERTSLLVR